MKGIKCFIILSILILSVTFISGKTPAFLSAQNDNVNITLQVTNNDNSITDNSTSCYLSIKYKDYLLVSNNVAMDYIGNGFFSSPAVTDRLGEYTVTLNCDGGGDYLSANFGYRVTQDGEEIGLEHTIVNIFLILFLIGLALGAYLVNKNTDLEKLNNTIINRYENKNYVKLVFSSIWYNLMKNCYIIYYLLGLPIIILTTTMANSYNLTSIVEILKVFMIVYLVGLTLVGIFFLGQVQEWFMDLLNKVRDMEWGIE